MFKRILIVATSIALVTAMVGAFANISMAQQTCPDGFEPEDGGLWQKNGVLFGREAALQYARRELRDSDEPNHFDEEA